MSGLVSALRILARHMTVGDEAADRIEALERELAEARAETALYRNAVEPLEKERDYEHDRAERLNLELTDARVEIEGLKADAAALVEALEHIQEYWNRNTNERAMQDACEFAIYRAGKALAIHGERGRKLLAVVKAALRPHNSGGPFTLVSAGWLKAICATKAAFDAKEPSCG